MIAEYCEQYHNMDVYDKLYFDSKMKSKTFTTEYEMIEFIRTNDINFYYSDFLIYELTPTAKKTQITIIHEYFKNNLHRELINDLIYRNGDFYLSCYSTNKNYLLNNWDIHDKYFKFINCILLKYNYEILNYEDLKQYVANNELYLSDFLTADYNNYTIINDMSNMIKIYNEMMDECNVPQNKRFCNLSYSQFIKNNSSREEKINILTNVYNVFIKSFEEAPKIDLIFKNNDIYASSNCDKINVSLPIF
jgi:hypothetical protein